MHEMGADAEGCYFPRKNANRVWRKAMHEMGADAEGCYFSMEKCE